MNTYEIKGDIRQKVILSIAVISIIVGNLLFGLSNSIAGVTENHLPAISDFLAEWEYLGVFSTQITFITMFSFFSWLFNNYLWRISWINKHLGVPDLNGSWEGVLESSVIENGANIKVDMKLEITQSWNRMTCTSIFPRSKSYSDIVCVDSESSKGVMLKFTYINHSEDVSSGLPQFAGYNELRLCDNNTLSGTYFTKRVPSTRGTILLVRRNAEDDINDLVKAK